MKPKYIAGKIHYFPHPSRSRTMLIKYSVILHVGAVKGAQVLLRCNWGTILSQTQLPFHKFDLSGLSAEKTTGE